MENQSGNIYQTPQSDLAVQGTGGVENFKRFSAWGVFGLSIVTLGIYQIYWLYNRTMTLNSFHENKIQMAWNYVLVCSLIATFVVAGLEGMYPDEPQVVTLSSLVNIAYLVSYLVVLFKLRNRLAEVMGVPLNGVYTFFANAIYLQYKINQNIDELAA
jgi:hypothetical protein